MISLRMSFNSKQVKILHIKYLLHCSYNIISIYIIYTEGQICRLQIAGCRLKIEKRKEERKKKKKENISNKHIL